MHLLVSCMYVRKLILHKTADIKSGVGLVRLTKGEKVISFRLHPQTLQQLSRHLRESLTL